MKLMIWRAGVNFRCGRANARRGGAAGPYHLLLPLLANHAGEHAPQRGL